MEQETNFIGFAYKKGEEKKKDIAILNNFNINYFK